MVSELVCLCTIPSPSNPFALDTRYIQSLPLHERFLVTGALLNFLEMYVVYGNKDEMYYDKGQSLLSGNSKNSPSMAMFSICLRLIIKYSGIIIVSQQVALFSHHLKELQPSALSLNH